MKIRPAFEDSSIPTKPQLHTRKHHNTYNGAKNLPHFTWVRPAPPAPPRKKKNIQLGRLPASTRSTRDNSNRNGSGSGSGSGSSTSRSSTAPEEIYEIKLYYPRNRSCTIYRTLEDFLRLRKGLSSSRYKALSPSSSGTSISIPDNAICPGRHAHDSTCLHKFLKYVMERSPTGMRGVGKEVEPALEFFLRRRIDDCGGCG